MHALVRIAARARTANLTAPLDSWIHLYIMTIMIAMMDRCFTVTISAHLQGCHRKLVCSSHNLRPPTSQAHAIIIVMVYVPWQFGISFNHNCCRKSTPSAKYQRNQSNRHKTPIECPYISHTLHWVQACVGREHFDFDHCLDSTVTKLRLDASYCKQSFDNPTSDPRVRSDWET